MNKEQELRNKVNKIIELVRAKDTNKNDLCEKRLILKIEELLK